MFAAINPTRPFSTVTLNVNLFCKRNKKAYFHMSDAPICLCRPGPEYKEHICKTYTKNGRTMSNIYGLILEEFNNKSKSLLLYSNFNNNSVFGNRMQCWWFGLYVEGDTYKPQFFRMMINPCLLDLVNTVTIFWHLDYALWPVLLLAIFCLTQPIRPTIEGMFELEIVIIGNSIHLPKF